MTINCAGQTEHWGLHLQVKTEDNFTELSAAERLLPRSSCFIYIRNKSWGPASSATTHPPTTRHMGSVTQDEPLFGF